EWAAGARGVDPLGIQRVDNNAGVERRADDVLLLLLERRAFAEKTVRRQHQEPVARLPRQIADAGEQRALRGLGDAARLVPFAVGLRNHLLGVVVAAGDAAADVAAGVGAGAVVHDSDAPVALGFLCHGGIQRR